MSMNGSLRKLILTATVATAAVLQSAAPRPASALFIGPNPGSVGGISFRVETVNAPGGAIFGPSGELVNIAGLPGAGAGYGSLGAPIPFQADVAGGIGAPAAPLGAVGAFQPPVPAVGFGDTFGGAANLLATTFSGGNGAGIFWPAPNFIWDDGADGQASIAFSRGIANFGNTADVNPIAGVGLAVSGTLGGQGPAGAFVAASLFGDFTIFNALGAPIDSFSMAIAIVSDGPGPRNDFIDGLSTKAGSLHFEDSLGLGTNSFFAWGVELVPAGLIPAGGSVTLDGTLSLVADPPFSIQIDILPLNAPRPDFGAVAAVPEPDSVAIAGLAMLALLIVARLRRLATA